MPSLIIRAVSVWNAALVNRGGDGLPKTGIVGGETRQYISSQCQKRALRADKNLTRVEADGTIVPDTLELVAERLGIGLSTRSPDAIDLRLRPELEKRRIEHAEAWTRAVASLYRKAAEGNARETEPEEDDERQIPIVLGQREVTALADLVELAIGDGLVAGDFLEGGKARGARRKLGVLANGVAALTDSASCGLDGALFGRFASSDLIMNIDGCVHVTHAYTTHPLQSWADFFSATADEATGPGAGHINTQPLSSGVFYRVAVLDLVQLRRNFASVSTKDQRAAIAAWLVRAFARANPAAKLGSTAPYSLPHDMAVELTELAPFTGTPFETVKATTAEAAVEQLKSHLAEADSLYGAPSLRLWLREMIEPTARQPALDRLAAAVEKALKEREAWLEAA